MANPPGALDHPVDHAVRGTGRPPSRRGLHRVRQGRSRRGGRRTLPRRGLHRVHLFVGPHHGGERGVHPQRVALHHRTARLGGARRARAAGDMDRHGVRRRGRRRHGRRRHRRRCAPRQHRRDHRGAGVRRLRGGFALGPPDRHAAAGLPGRHLHGDGRGGDGRELRLFALRHRRLRPHGRRPGGRRHDPIHRGIAPCARRRAGPVVADRGRPRPLWVWLWIGEAPRLWTLAGGAVVFAAIACHALSGMRRKPPPLGAV